MTAVTRHAPLKRERTRQDLLRAAVAVFSGRGVEAASILEITQAAGVANGTFYNHFQDKDAIVEAVAGWLTVSLCERIARSQATVEDGAERMAIGNRRYILLAAEHPAWALLFLDVAAVAPHRLADVTRYAMADLDLGLRQGRFAVRDRRAALDLIAGTVAQAMRTVALSAAPRGHPSRIAALVLRGLGMAAGEADAVARRKLPPLPAETMPLPPLPPRG